MSLFCGWKHIVVESGHSKMQTGKVTQTTTLYNCDKQKSISADTKYCMAYNTEDQVLFH